MRAQALPAGAVPIPPPARWPIPRPVAVDRVRIWRNETIPYRGSLGKYEPPKNGRPSGVRKRVIGQPPAPFIACTAAIYTASRSGRSSRSTLIETKLAFSMAAVFSSSNDSRSMTWHQWQAA
jgi:hypothetical protein